MIMGNKSDKEIERKVTKEEGRLLALVSYKSDKEI